MKTTNIFCLFFKFSLDFRPHALQSKLNKNSISNFLKFWLQSMSSKIERSLKKKEKQSLKIRLKRILIRQLQRTINQCKVSYMRKKTDYFVECIAIHYKQHLYGIGKQYYQISLYMENDVQTYFSWTSTWQCFVRSLCSPQEAYCTHIYRFGGP